VRVGASARLQRNIIITKQSETERKVLSAGLTPVGWRTRVVPSLTKTRAVTACRRYLRHLPRTILRDGRLPGSNRADFASPSFLDWVVAESAQMQRRSSRTRRSPDRLTSSPRAQSHRLRAGCRQLPRGAYPAVGAPVGVYGDWRLRGALSTEARRRVALGEYEARRRRMRPRCDVHGAR
jgi:hypothetical protein